MTGGGGLQNGRGGGQVKFYPYKKGGGEKRFSHPEGGCTKGFGVVLTRELEVLTILEGGTKGFQPLKRGHKSFILS